MGLLLYCVGAWCIMPPTTDLDHHILERGTAVSCAHSSLYVDKAL
jgi:hypothetical protein